MALPDASHRPWPLPAGPWIMAQSWCDLLFAHWAVPPDAIRPLVPEDLSIDDFGGRAWVGVVPFRMEDVRFRLLPPIPTMSAFPELNVRTYVTLDGKPGVWFFSLDAESGLAVAGARAALALPYFEARMRQLKLSRGDLFEYESTRTHAGAPPAEFRGTYGPAGEAFRAKPGSLEQFLSERYCLYSSEASGLLRCEIHHAPWELAPARAEIRTNTMLSAAGISHPGGPPHLLFSKRIDAFVWMPERL